MEWCRPRDGRSVSHGCPAPQVDVLAEAAHTPLHLGLGWGGPGVESVLGRVSSKNMSLECFKLYCRALDQSEERSRCRHSVFASLNSMQKADLYLVQVDVSSCLLREDP